MKRIVVVDENAPFRISLLLEQAGWQPHHCRLSDIPTLRLIEVRPPLLLWRILDRTQFVTDRLVAKLRAEATNIACLPVLAFGTWRTTQFAASVNGADSHIRTDEEGATIIAAILSYEVAAPPELGRLQRHFGSEAIETLVEGLKSTLISALPTLDDGDMTMAHRIAGSAGIIGFAELGRAWSDYEHGRCSPVTVARLTRRAIAQLTHAADT
ncbi:hypothetical protein [Sphingomonas guangdongensis]|uniref:hypothetical protein n=1 Tax=Sphingomonas guangdongensis TaxID=1141890 RepID=UPI0011819A97|nr:hypothetical protein [Sphingomonas guangdongensis]